MNNTTIRRLYLIGIIAAAILFIAMVIDYYANDAGWMTGLAIVFAVVAALLILMLLLSADPDTIDAVPSNEDWIGQVHQVVDLEGIGPTYAAKLDAIGVVHTQQLLFTPDAKLSQATGAPAKTVANWKAMSQLVKVSGIGPQYAEAAVRAGIDSIEELRDEPAAAIAGAIQGYLDSLDSTVIGQKVTTKRVEGWQKAARKLEWGQIQMATLKVMPLESKAAKADAA